MKEVNKEVLKKAAENLLFDMEEEEYDALLEEFDIILKQLKLMDNIKDLDKYEPMSFPYINTEFNLLREDEVDNELILNKDEVLKNAKETKDGQIKLPKVVG